MRTKTIAASAVVIAVLLGDLILVAAGRPCSPITVRHVKSVESAAGIRTTFEISNHTANPYAVLPLEVEARNGQVWQRCFFFVEQSYSPSVIYPWRDVVGPHGFASRVFELTNLPPDVPLRLRLTIDREPTGVRGFWERVQYRLHTVGYMSLNPSDKYTHVFDRNFIQTTSEEFIEQKHQGDSKK